MKLIVQLHRQPKEQRDYGYLRAHVVEDAKLGRDLLSGKHGTGIEAAKRKVKRELDHLMPDAKITFEGPEREV
jgi:hypothetical protein